MQSEQLGMSNANTWQLEQVSALADEMTGAAFT